MNPVEGSQINGFSEARRRLELLAEQVHPGRFISSLTWTYGDFMLERRYFELLDCVITRAIPNLVNIIKFGIESASMAYAIRAFAKMKPGVALAYTLRDELVKNALFPLLDRTAQAAINALDRANFQDLQNYLAIFLSPLRFTIDARRVSGWLTYATQVPIYHVGFVNAIARETQILADGFTSGVHMSLGANTQWTFVDHQMWYYIKVAYLNMAPLYRQRLYNDLLR